MGYGCDTFDPFDTWLSMPNATFGTQYHLNACEIHCPNCIIESQWNIGVSDEGERWVRPAEIMHTYQQGVPSRDAYGKFHALVSNRPHLYPYRACFDHASCYQNNGIEGFKGTVCKCDPELDVLYGDNWHTGMPDCRDGTDTYEVRTGWMADGFFYNGNTISSAYDTWLQCRPENIVGLYPMRRCVINDAGSLHTLRTMRTNRYCLANLLVLAIGERPETLCWNAPDQYPDGPYYFNDSANREHDWGWWHINHFDPSIVNDPERHPQDWGASNIRLAIQNAAITAGANRFSALEHKDIYRPNSVLGDWENAFAAESYADAPVIYELPHCWLRFSRLPVSATVHLLSARLKINLVFQKLLHYPPGFDASEDTPEPQLWIAARAHLHVELGVQATLTGETETTLPGGETVTLSIANPTSVQQRYPTVGPLGLDEIVFAEGGTAITPPDETDWWGSQQATSSGDGIWHNWWAGDYEEPSGTVTDYCHALALQFPYETPIRIYGMPDVYTPEARIRKYAGSLSIYLNA